MNSIYVLCFTYSNSIYIFVLRTRIQHMYFKYVKQSMYIEFEYVKQSTYIEVKYVLRVPDTLFPVLQVFWLFVLIKACWWVAVNMLKLYWEKRNWWLQLHFTVRSTSFSKVWFHLTFCFRTLGSFGIFWETSLTNLTPLHVILRACRIFEKKFSGGHWPIEPLHMWVYGNPYLDLSTFCNKYNHFWPVEYVNRGSTVSPFCS